MDLHCIIRDRYRINSALALDVDAKRRSFRREIICYTSDGKVIAASIRDEYAPTGRKNFNYATEKLKSSRNYWVLEPGPNGWSSWRELIDTDSIPQLPPSDAGSRTQWCPPLPPLDAGSRTQWCPPLPSLDPGSGTLVPTSATLGFGIKDPMVLTIPSLGLRNCGSHRFLMLLPGSIAGGT